MRFSLKPHPDTPCPAVTGISVSLSRPSPEELSLVYEVRGALEGIIIPRSATPARGHRLWEHTVFEVFIRPEGGEAYWEFNFAPSGEWAAYRLGGYRTDMKDARQPNPPRIAVEQDGETLRATVDLDTGLPADRPWKIGLSAIIEEEDGRKSYWALAHAPGVPDFHHKDCFALELAAPPAP